MTLSEKAKLIGSCKGLKVNDVSGIVLKYKTINGKKKRTWICPFYRTWNNIFKRCFTKSYLAENETYRDVHVCDDWFRFSNFKSWMEKQDWQGMQLDKDILSVDGNLVYSPTTCAFIPKRINNLFIGNKNNANTGEQPLGVSLENYRREDSKNKFVASLSIRGKHKRLGVYSSREEAHKVWQEGKILVILDSVDWYKQQRSFRKDVVDALLNRVETLRSDINKGVITECL